MKTCVWGIVGSATGVNVAWVRCKYPAALADPPWTSTAVGTRGAMRPVCGRTAVIPRSRSRSISRRAMTGAVKRKTVETQPAAATDTGINRSGCSSPGRWQRLPEAAQSQRPF
jgi:hypothetical protein